MFEWSWELNSSRSRHSLSLSPFRPSSSPPPSSIIMPRRDVRTHYGRTKWQFRRIKRHEERLPPLSPPPPSPSPPPPRSRKDAIKSKMHYDQHDDYQAFFERRDVKNSIFERARKTFISPIISVIRIGKSLFLALVKEIYITRRGRFHVRMEILWFKFFV